MIVALVLSAWVVGLGITRRVSPDTGVLALLWPIAVPFVLLYRSGLYVGDKVAAALRGPVKDPAIVAGEKEVENLLRGWSNV